jgi:hypothetical protein
LDAEASCRSGPIPDALAAESNLVRLFLPLTRLVLLACSCFSPG